MKNLLQKYALIPLALLCAFYICKAFGLPAHDFANYYFGGKFLAEGRFGSWIYFPYEFNKAIAAEGYQQIFASYAPNTPFLALFFLPFSFLPLAVAKLIFNSISTGLFLFTLNRLANFYRIPKHYLILMPILFFVPIKNGLLFGQVYFLLFSLLGETWMAYRNERMKTAAWCFSLAILLKIFPILLLPAFLFRKKFSLLAYTAGCCSLLVLGSVVSSGSDVWLFFVESVLPKASGGEISESYVRNYQSIFMLLKEMLVYDSTENPDPLLHQPVVLAALVFALKIAMVTAGYYVSRKVKTPLFVLSFWMLAMLLLPPYGSTYGLILLVFSFLCLSKMTIPKWQKALICVMILGICNIPVFWLLKQVFPFSYTRLMLMLLLLLFCCLSVWRLIKWKFIAFAVLAATMTVMVFLKPVQDNSKAVLSKDEPILIYDYTISNHTLTYFYWDKQGENKASIAFSGATEDDLALHENEVFYHGRQITFDKSNKRKAFVTDDKRVVYLSDSGRGIGFYNLREIKVPEFR